MRTLRLKEAKTFAQDYTRSFVVWHQICVSLSVTGCLRLEVKQLDQGPWLASDSCIVFGKLLLCGVLFSCEMAHVPFLAAGGAVNHGGPLFCDNRNGVRVPGLANQSAIFPWLQWLVKGWACDFSQDNRNLLQGISARATGERALSAGVAKSEGCGSSTAGIGRPACLQSQVKTSHEARESSGSTSVPGSSYAWSHFSPWTPQLRESVNSHFWSQLIWLGLVVFAVQCANLEVVSSISEQ